MAWSLVSSTQYQSGGTIATNFTVGLTSYSSGDVAIITTYKDQDLGDWSTSSSGWDLLKSKRSATGRDRSVALFYKVLGSSESNPVVVYSDATSEEISWTLHIFRPASGKSASQANVISNWNNSNNLNIQNPTFPELTTLRDNSAIFCIQMQTHDDCTAVGAPTGYTIGETIYGGSRDNRQQLAFYNLDVGTAGNKTIGAPTSTWNNTVSEFSLFDITLEADPTIGITNQDDEQLDIGDTNEVITGFGFGSSQGSGKVELCNTINYTGTKVTQSIDSWADTSIQFDPVFTGLDEGSVWLYVTHNSGEISAAYAINYGELPYPDFVKSLTPDIYHRFNNSYTDEKGIADANSQTSSGTFGFHLTPITRNNSYSWSVADSNSKIEMSDTDYTNFSINKMRTIGGWIHLDRVHLVPSGFYEEGGGVNNVYMVVGYGNTILANLADSNGSPDYKIQGFSNKKLTVNRVYHVMIQFRCSTSAGADDGRFYFYIDGIKQDKYAGIETIPNQIKDIGFSKHSGDWSYGKPDANLDTGGTDINYPGAPNTLLSDWATWSDNFGDNMPNDNEIRELFLRGAIPTNSIHSDTPANMQDETDLLADTDYEDKAIPIKVYSPIGSNNLSLDFDNITFDDRCSVQVIWMGSGTLTITNLNGAAAVSSKCATLGGGSIAVINSKIFTISNLLTGSRVEIYDNEVSNIGNHDTKLAEIISSGTSFTYSHFGTSNDIIIKVFKSNYVEIKIAISLNNTDQIVFVNQEIDTNI